MQPSTLRRGWHGCRAQNAVCRAADATQTRPSREKVTVALSSNPYTRHNTSNSLALLTSLYKKYKINLAKKGTWFE